MKIPSLIIEITRRCQLRCEHCLRGDAQNLDIDPAHIDAILSQVSHIGELTFSGGEPSLNPKAIQYFIDEAERQGVGISDFYIATNAHHISDEFLLTVMRLHCYCDDNEISLIQWSNDNFHATETDQEGIAKLKTLSFAFPRNPTDRPTDPSNLLSQGNYEGRTYNQPRDGGFSFDEEEVTEGYVYLAADGWIISNCDWSYENQKDHRVCRVEDFNLDRLKEYVPLTRKKEVV